MDFLANLFSLNNYELIFFGSLLSWLLWLV